MSAGMTILGPCPCHGCGGTVTVVRQRVVVWCSDACRACKAQTGTKHRHGAATRLTETVTLDADGERHLCPVPKSAPR